MRGCVYKQHGCFGGVGDCDLNGATDFFSHLVFPRLRNVVFFLQRGLGGEDLASLGVAGAGLYLWSAFYDYGVGIHQVSAIL